MLLGKVTAGDASSCGAKNSVMPSIVSGNATNDRAFDTAFGIGGTCDRRYGQSDKEACKIGAHF
jgi:hypothetical protein